MPPSILLIALWIISSSIAPALGSTPVAPYLYEPGKAIYHKPSCTYAKRAATTRPATSRAIAVHSLSPCLVCFTKAERDQLSDADLGDRKAPSAHAKPAAQILLSDLRVGMTGQLLCPPDSLRYHGPHAFCVTRLVGNRKMFLSAAPYLLCIQGLPTSGLDPGQVIDLPQIFAITGKTKFDPEQSPSPKHRVFQGNRSTRGRVPRPRPIHRAPSASKAPQSCFIATYQSGPRLVEPWPEIIASRLEVGHVGRMIYAPGTPLGRTYQVGPKSFQLLVGNHQDVTIRIEQILGPDEMLARAGFQPVRIRGLPTPGLVDGGSYHFTGQFEVIGTVTHPTPTGSTHTRLVISPLNEDGHLRPIPR